MADLQTIVLGCSGLQADPGPFVAGSSALVEATNVSYRRPGRIEPRGPFSYRPADAALSSSAEPYCVFWYSDGSTGYDYWAGKDGSTSYLRQYRSATIGGSFTFSRDKTHFAQIQGRGVLTTDQGVAVLDSISAASLRLGGVPRGPAFRLAWTTGASGWLAPNYSTGYRTCVARAVGPAPQSIIRGAPSEMKLAANNGVQLSSANAYPTLRIYISPDIVAGDYIEIYRMQRASSPLVSSYFNQEMPADEGRLRASIRVTSADVAAGYVDFADQVDDGLWTGPALYTNASQDGILLSNERPGYARDVAEYNGMTFYAAHMSPQRVTLQLRGSGLAADYASPPPWGNAGDLQRRLCGYICSATFTSGSATVSVTSGDIPYLAVGMRLNTGTGTSVSPIAGDSVVPADAYIVSIGASSFTMSANALSSSASVYTRFYDWLEVDDGVTKRRVYTCYGYSYPEPVFDAFFNGAPQFREVIGAAAGASLSGGSSEIERAWSAAYGSASFRLSAVSSASTQNEDITLRIERTDASLGAFTVRSSKPLAFDRYVDSSTGVASAQEGASGRLAWSKILEPEAIPLPYYTELGKQNAPIYRIVATRDALYIFKADGVWRAFGSSPDAMSFQLLDSTAGLEGGACNAVVAYGDAVYARTQRGFVRVGNFGVQNIDSSINRAAFGPSSSPSKSWASASLSGRWVVFGWSDSPTAYAWAFFPESGQWAKWTFRSDVTAGAFSEAYGPLLGVARTTLDAYYDRDYQWSYVSGDSGSASVSGIVGNRVTIASGSWWTPAVGDYVRLRSDTAYRAVTNVVSATEFDLEDASGGTTGSASVLLKTPVRVTWAAAPAGTPAQVKRFTDAQLLFGAVYEGSTFTAEFTGYRNATTATQTITYDASGSEYASAKPYQCRVHVPVSVGRDWALKLGFEWSNPSSTFACDGAALTYAVTGNRV